MQFRVLQARQGKWFLLSWLVSSLDSPLPTRDATRLRYRTSWLDFNDWRNSQKTFVDLAAWSVGTMNVSDEPRPPERYNGAYFTANAFAVLRQPPLLGRDFVRDGDQPGATPMVMLGITNED